MGNVALQAKASFPYAGRSIETGETFLASEKDAALLKLVGRAIDAPPPRLRRKDLEPSSDETAEEPKQKRHYRRRDLVPEP